MAVNSRAVSVTTTATRLDVADDTADAQAGQTVTLYNNGSQAVYIGGPGVTVATGAPIAATTYGPAFNVATGDALYGIVAATTAEVRVLETGV